MTSQRARVTAAIVLWVVFAFLVWNVIFDRVLVLAGRRYSHDATVLYRSTGRYLSIDDVMRPAVVHGFRVASLTAGAIVIGALVLIRLASAHDTRRQR